ncbi:2-succinyl-5-enolpyruvyl-6-hydroxy-3-cyclohexene-1-carboxylate synthase [Agromyces rhizosphaerae]|uniref:2-succinyl-5-enolpyruvyl-6-hydroxy-3-cyclohexene-1-carboxylate synthase n=1 Tax=Agromyces rhizosphaerae TaxID=88374 RepID=A0A9W6CWZ9_9MICO|nr:2-succinyl-5-enolpyruvyl-6-hydroxy-3-cyclohexene-1-carboxylic-acid synthase [Agromyces rhizosphaerae]GLI26859.1 2-succinyl-5-enolpyruvyl-6-hydroxy-3-cyclohexene-1-carboxylate synthase [Agromyces rhizosphaerae]
MPDASPAPSPASDVAHALLEGLVAAGVTDLVVSPGSRSQALALAAAELEQRGLVRLHVRIDERGAGFLAVGLARESGRPAAVITTSGTAVANLHPAVLEAHHSGVPLVVVTADRPEELQRVRANQTTVQPGIFAGAVRLEHDVAAPEGLVGETDAAQAIARDAVAASLGLDADGAFVPDPGPGPVHVNLAMREPLSGARTSDAAAPAGGGSAASVIAVAPHASAAVGPHGALIAHGPRTVVVAGAGAGPEAEQFARDGGWPLFAEVVSGAHFGPNLVVAYRELLRDVVFAGAIERVVVFGHPTLSREVPALVARDGVEAIVVAPSGIEWYNPGHGVDRFHRAVRVEPRRPGAEERAWVGRWVFTSRRMLEPAPSESYVPSAEPTPHDHDLDLAELDARRAYVQASVDAMREPVTRRSLVEAVWSATWPHDRLVFGASRLVRDADRAVAGRRVTVHANRGLSGIDGTVATALGVAIASQFPPPGVADEAADAPAHGTTRALIGDVTLLHDAGSLLAGSGERMPRLQVIVGNDGGGSIFDALEVAGTADPAAFDRVQFTPHAVDLAALARAYGWEYAHADTAGALDAALTATRPGPVLIEVPLAR